MRRWDIRRKGRKWTAEEYEERLAGAPEKMELIAGKLYGSSEERLHMLGMLLEQVGAEEAVKLGDPDVWRQAVARLSAGRE